MNSTKVNKVFSNLLVSKRVVVNFESSFQGKLSMALVSYWMAPKNASNEADVAAADKTLQFMVSIVTGRLLKLRIMSKLPKK